MFTSFMDFLDRVLVSRNQGHKSWSLPELATHEGQKDSFVPLAIILDSCPGFGGIRRRGSAFVASIKSPLLKSVALVPATIAFSTLLGTLYLFGAPQVTTIFYDARSFTEQFNRTRSFGLFNPSSICI